MKYSLASRELIADSVETMVMAHGLDGVVLLPNCDKIVPGMVMAAARLDLPAVVVSGGPMLAGRYEGQEVSLSSFSKRPVHGRPGLSARNSLKLARWVPALAAAVAQGCILPTA